MNTFFHDMPNERLAHREAVRKSIHDSAVFTSAFVTMNALATVIACCGLLEDSPAVVIGAMVIATLLGPISGIALALVDGDYRLLRKALLAEASGAVLVIGVALLIGALHRDGPLTREILSRTRPSLLDLIIALAGGAAGASASSTDAAPGDSGLLSATVGSGGTRPHAAAPRGNRAPPRSDGNAGDPGGIGAQGPGGIGPVGGVGDDRHGLPPERGSAHGKNHRRGALFYQQPACPSPAFGWCGQHWGIENSLHWGLDVAFNEDRMRQRDRTAIENLALLNRLAVSLLRQDKRVKAGVKCKRKRAGWDNDYLLHLLCTPT
jgi:uncharacterized hydrophobic protein (TIGR00271 family)